MGYLTELNTLLRFSTKDIDPQTLKVGTSYTIMRPRERMFPLHIAVLLIDENWNFYGYAVVHESTIKEKTTALRFEVLTLFSPAEQKVYTSRFLEAARKTGEI